MGGVRVRATRRSSHRVFVSKGLLARIANSSLRRLRESRPMVYMGSIARAGTRQEIDASALNEVSIADGSRRPRRVIVLMPIGPCTVPALVVDELKQVSWYPHLPRADARALGNAGYVYRSSDDVDIPGCSLDIASCRHLDRFGPDSTVVFRSLRHHVGQREALGHRLSCRHITCRSM